MLFVWVMLAWFPAPHHTEVSDPTVCRCHEVRSLDGWCGKCRVGFFATVRIESASLFRVLDLHGHDVVAEMTRCQRCREAMSSDAFCDDCQMGFLDGRGYFSRLCYAMARGRWSGVADRPRTVMICPVADYWCGACQRGRVANRTFDRPEDFRDAKHWLDVLRAAVDKSQECEICAAAMIANGLCYRCRVAYRDGQVRPLTTPSSDESATDDDGSGRAVAGRDGDPGRLEAEPGASEIGEPGDWHRWNQGGSADRYRKGGAP